MTTAVVVPKRKRGRPGREVLPCTNARNTTLAVRNRRIKQALTRKRKPMTQAEAAAKYGLDQSAVSVIVRNPCSDKVTV